MVSIFNLINHKGKKKKKVIMWVAVTVKASHSKKNRKIKKVGNTMVWKA